MKSITRVSMNAKFAVSTAAPKLQIFCLRFWEVRCYKRESCTPNSRFETRAKRRGFKLLKATVGLLHFHTRQ